MANRKPQWTDEDVKLSKKGVDDADYTLNMNANNSSPKETSLTLYNNVRKFWNRYGEEFSQFWREIPKKEKLHFLKTVSPYLAKNKNDPNANDLLSDFTIETLLENDGERFLEMFKERASSHDLLFQDFEFCDVNNVRLNTNAPNEYYLLDKKYKINESKMQGEFLQQFNHMKSLKTAFEANFYEAAYNRYITILQHFSLWADEYRIEVLGKKDYKTVNLNICNNCGEKNAADGSSLKECARCRVVKYCSRECQKEDWKTHKGFCNQTVMQQQDGSQEKKKSVSDTVDYMNTEFNCWKLL